MTHRLALVRGQLEAMRAHINNTMSLCCIKLIWHAQMQHGDDTYDFEVIDPVEPPRHVITVHADPANLRSHVDGFMVEIRRTYLNDLYLTVARHSLKADNLVKGIEPPEPEFHAEAHEGEIASLSRFLRKEDKRFLDFFRRLRNSTVHYDGNHNRRNALDYEFNGTHFLTTDANLGKQIEYWFSDLFLLHERLKEAFDVERITANPHLLRELGVITGAA